MSSPFPIFESQNLKDDDGQVIDSFLIETDTPPDLKMATEVIPIPAPEHITRPTRLLAGTEILVSGTAPYRLLPADANRVQFHLDGYSFNATPGAVDYALVADENGKINILSNQGSTRIRHNKGIDIDNHTGEIWVSPGPTAANNFEVTWRAVTK